MRWEKPGVSLQPLEKLPKTTPLGEFSVQKSLRGGRNHLIQHSISDKASYHKWRTSSHSTDRFLTFCPRERESKSESESESESEREKREREEREHDASSGL